MSDNIQKEQSKEGIKKLIEKYHRILSSGEIKKYNEEMTKKDFILPLFRFLGWEVEDSMEVTAEEKVSKNRVDYAFRLNGIPKLFLEAKKLSEDIDDMAHARQVINYAYHKGVTWAVLTNFSGIRVFNAEWKTENVAHNKFISLNYDNFIENFDKLWWLSKESLEIGILNKEAELVGKRTKKIPIDKQLLSDFMKWREMLSKNIIKNNQTRNLTEEQLDEVVQRILDRLIFIRNCEDRELETKKLKEKIRECEDRGNKKFIVYLREIFDYFDDHYDSELFRFHLCDDIEIDNDIFYEIISGLYNTSDNLTSYDFSAMDADILGNMYEQYLGNILRKTDKRAKVEARHNHRKAQGIYYTPTYIVDYIVKKTLGELLKDKNADPEKIHILDPACGSGSFLIKSFDVLYEYFKKKTGEESFTIRNKIVTENIFGVDLDTKAVEIARLNLLLKATEKRYKLPMLQQNIRCGNSLIDDPETAGEDKYFNWEDKFKDIIIKEGGFDIVIGNPPYIRNTELSDKDKEFFGRAYSSAYKQYDIFVLFFDIGLKLLKDNGYLGFITSNKFIASEYGEKLRELILKKCKILSIIDVSNLKIFKDASTYPVITILQKDGDEKSRNSNMIRFQKIAKIEDLYTNNNVSTIKQSKFIESGDNRFLEYKMSVKSELVKKIEYGSVKIKDILICQRGSPKNKIKILNEKTEKSLPCIISRDVDRFYPKISNKIFVISNLQDEILFEEKILIPRTVLVVRAAYEEGKNFIMDRIYYLVPKDKTKVNLKFITGVLNSKLIDFYYKINFGSTHVGGNYLDLRGSQINELPIKIIPEEKQKQLIKFVDRIISLKKQLDEMGDKKTDDEYRISEEIEKTEKEIDNFVYKLYNLTTKEIEIIEGNFS